MIESIENKIAQLVREYYKETGVKVHSMEIYWLEFFGDIHDVPANIHVGSSKQPEVIDDENNT